MREQSSPEKTKENFGRFIDWSFNDYRLCEVRQITEHCFIKYRDAI